MMATTTLNLRRYQGQEDADAERNNSTFTLSMFRRPSKNRCIEEFCVYFQLSNFSDDDFEFAPPLPLDQTVGFAVVEALA